MRRPGRAAASGHPRASSRARRASPPGPRDRSPRRCRAAAGSSRRTPGAPRARSASPTARSAAARPRCAPASLAATARDRSRARRPHPRRAGDSPPGSRRSSSCRPRSARGCRTPRRDRPRSRSRAAPRVSRRPCAARVPRSRSTPDPLDGQLHDPGRQESRIGARQGDGDLGAVGLVTDRRDRAVGALQRGAQQVRRGTGLQPRVDLQRRARRSARSPWPSAGRGAAGSTRRAPAARAAPRDALRAHEPARDPSPSARAGRPGRPAQPRRVGTGRHAQGQCTGGQAPPRQAPGSRNERGKNSSATPFPWTTARSGGPRSSASWGRNRRALLRPRRVRAPRQGGAEQRRGARPLERLEDLHHRQQDAEHRSGRVPAADRRSCRAAGHPDARRPALAPTGRAGLRLPLRHGLVGLRRAVGRRPARGRDRAGKAARRAGGRSASSPTRCRTTTRSPTSRRCSPT